MTTCCHKVCARCCNFEYHEKSQNNEVLLCSYHSAGNQRSDNTIVFRRDAATGMFEFNKDFETPQECPYQLEHLLKKKWSEYYLSKNAQEHLSYQFYRQYVIARKFNIFEHDSVRRNLEWACASVDRIKELLKFIPKKTFYKGSNDSMKKLEEANVELRFAMEKFEEAYYKIQG